MYIPFMPMSPLAQLTVDDNPPPKDTPPRMTLTDLKQGLRDVQDGKVDTSTFRNGIITLLAVLALIVLVIHLRQRRKKAAPPDNLRKLGRELGRKVPFPLGAKFLLHCVARATKTPFPALLLSAALFDKCVAQWAREPSFAAVRNWGRSRLLHLRPVLFD
jgi:hypothetical protein